MCNEKVTTLSLFTGIRCPLCCSLFLPRFSPSDREKLGFFSSYRFRPRYSSCLQAGGRTCQSSACPCARCPDSSSCWCHFCFWPHTPFIQTHYTPIMACKTQSLNFIPQTRKGLHYPLFFKRPLHPFKALVLGISVLGKINVWHSEHEPYFLCQT